MSVAPLNLGWLLVVFMLGQELGQAQIRRINAARVPSRANALSVVWSPSPSPEVVGYTLYWGLSDQSCTNRITLHNVTNVTLVGFKRRQMYHLAVAAYDATGDESPRSNSIQYSRPPPVVVPVFPPPNTASNLLQLQHVKLAGTNSVLRLSFTGQADVEYQLEATEDFQHWDVLYTTNCVEQQLVLCELPFSATTPRRFFRLLQE